MRFERIRSIRPLTKLMLKLLKDCYHREKHGMETVSIYEPDLVKGLMERDLIENSDTKGKKELYKLTALGNEYMKHYFPDES